MKICTRIKHSALLAVSALFILAGGALAMSSANFRLDWHTLPLASGGGASASTHFAANVTFGQPVVITMGSPNYRLGLGYWAGLPLFDVHLPVIQRNP